ncbi:unnamed protein product, partial [marine sediment metagenome]
LTRFSQPSMWVDWPNYINGLSNGDNTLSGAGRYISEQPKDINKTNLGAKNHIDLSTLVANEINRVQLTSSRLNVNEQYREIGATTAVSLLAVMAVINAHGGAVTSLRESGTYMEANSDYVRNPAGTGPDSLLEIAFFLPTLT